MDKTSATLATSNRRIRLTVINDEIYIFKTRRLIGQRRLQKNQPTPGTLAPPQQPLRTSVISITFALTKKKRTHSPLFKAQERKKRRKNLPGNYILFHFNGKKSFLFISFTNLFVMYFFNFSLFWMVKLEAIMTFLLRLIMEIYFVISSLIFC